MQTDHFPTQSNKNQINESGVSPLIGLILIMAIVMGLIGIMQSQWVPVWNKQVEAKHLDRLSYEVADVSEAISMAAQTGSPAKVVLDAGVRYPNYYILFSPSEGSSTIWAERLNVTIDGVVDLGFKKEVNKEFRTSAIVIKPNYFYSSSPLFVYEHSAVLKLGNSVVKVSDQNSFSKQRIVLYIVNSTIPSYATTGNFNLITTPISYGGVVRFSGNLVFESYNNHTAEWWNETLSAIYGNVTRNGKEINITLDNAELSIVYDIVSLGGVEFHAYTNASHLKPLLNTSTTYKIPAGQTKDFGVQVLDDYWNPVKNADELKKVGVSGCSNVYYQDSEVWCQFTNTTGNYEIKFSLGSESVVYNVRVISPSTGGGGGCVFNAYWMEGDNLLWNVSLEGLNKNLNFRVEYLSDPVFNAQVYFAITNTSVLTASSYEAKTNASGIAQINLTANNNGSTSVFGTVAGCVDVMNITIEGFTGNHPPTPPTLTTDKLRYYLGETIHATASGSADPDGDPITYYYKFYDYTSHSILQDWSTVNTYTITASEEGHVIRVYAKACDDKGACSSEVYKDVGVIKVVTLYPSDDAFVDNFCTGCNYGNYQYLLVRTWRLIWGEYLSRTYVKFNLSSSIPPGSHIVNASLKLYKYWTNANRRTYGAHRVNEPWSESTITWNTQPAFNPTPTVTVNPGSGSGWLSWNVKSDVQDFVNGTANNYGWCIKDENEVEGRNSRTYFYSKEYVTNKPQLVVEYSPI